MSEMEEKLGAILGNPQMMQQILSMAQSMGGNENQQAPPPRQEANLPMDPRMLQAIAGMARSSGVDRNQQTLLSALRPYLSQGRIHKLEKAMRAAKMAGLASGFLNSGALQMLAGR